MPTLFWTLHQAGEKVSFPVSATCCCFLVGEKTTGCTRVCKHTPQPSSFHAPDPPMAAHYSKSLQVTSAIKTCPAATP